MDERQDSVVQKDSINVIRKNMVQTRTQLFEGGDTAALTDASKDKPPLDVKSSPQITETCRPQITTPKPKLPSSVSPAKTEDKQDTPNIKGAIAKKTVLFETGNREKLEKDNMDVDKSCSSPKQIGHRRVLSYQDPQKCALFETNELLTESQVVRPKTAANMPIYAQVDKNRKSVGKGRPPKPSIPKIDRMRGRIPSDGHRYDGVVLLPVDPLPKAVDPSQLPNPPVKPPRTFAHDEYLRIKAEKKKQLTAKLNEIVPEENDHQQDTKNTKVPRKPAPGIPTTKPPLPKDFSAKPPTKPKRPERPPSLTEKTEKTGALTSSTGSQHHYEEIGDVGRADKVLTLSTNLHGYELIDGAGNNQKTVARDRVTSNGNVCHYEEIDSRSTAVRDSPNITVRRKSKQIGSATPDGQSARPKSKPPPPPRPPLPSDNDDAAATTTTPTTTPTTTTTTTTSKQDDARWDKGFVRVVKHNSRLRDEDFIGDKNVLNPSYGKKHSIVGGQILNEAAVLKRFKSDECLYAEIGEEGGFALKLNEAVYHDPVDILPTSPGEKGCLTEHGVVVDAEGYAIPDTGSHSADRKHFRKNLQRSGTIASGNRPTFLNKTPPSSKSPTATAINRKRSPQVRDKLSRAYSVLRKRPIDGSGDATQTTSLNCVPEDDAESMPDCRWSFMEKVHRDDSSDQEVDPEDQKKRLQHVASIKESRYGTLSHYASYRPRRRSRELYAYALIVGLEHTGPDSQQHKPAVLFTHPKETVPDNISVIADFCFPDASIWRPVTQYTSESFSFVLTNNEGQRQYGYCKRILPPGKCNRLPEVYCVVTDVGAWSLYGQLLDAAELKRQLSLRHVEELLVAGLRATLPAPGKEAWIHAMAANHSKETLILKRSADSRQETVSFDTLMKKLSTENLLKVFASILLERRIIFVGQHLSTLTCCIHAVVSLLYPFSWQHTFVPILPAAMLEICCSPTPYIAGILTAAQPKLSHMDMEQVLQVDLDNNCLLDQVGDEDRIIPRKLQKALSAALKEDGNTDSSSAGGSRDVMVFEVFLRLFVETVGHFSDYIFTQQDGKAVFLREQFVTAVNSKSIRMFLEWFTETQMFDAFITNQLDQDGQGAELFEVRIVEYRQEMADMSPTLRDNFKEVGRKMLNFIMESGAKVKKALHNQNNNVFV